MTAPMVHCRGLKTYDDIMRIEKGEFYFVRNASGDVKSIVLWISDYNSPIHLPIRGPSTSRPSWEWDGNLEQPTLTPSIHINPNGGPPNEWHGFLTAGIARVA